MTVLNTAIIIQGKQDPWAIYQTALQQLLFYDGRLNEHSETSWRTREETDGREFIYASDSGLLTNLAVYHRPDGRPVFSEEEARQKLHTNCTEPDCDVPKKFASQMIVLLATPLSYTDKRGWNAGNLHSGMVWSIGGYLDNGRVSWSWHENVTQHTHEGYEELGLLPEGVRRAMQGLANPLTGVQVTAFEVLRRLGLLPDEE